MAQTGLELIVEVSKARWNYASRSTSGNQKARNNEWTPRL